MKCLSCTDFPFFPCKTLMYAVVKRCCTRLERWSTSGVRSKDGERERENDTCAYYSFFPRKANCTRRPERAIKFHRKRKTLRGTTGRYRFFAIVRGLYTGREKYSNRGSFEKERGKVFHETRRYRWFRKYFSSTVRRDSPCIRTRNNACIHRP